MAEAKRLAEELAETREELEELQNQMDQQLEDHNKEMEEFEDGLKAQYAEEIRTRDETIAQLEQQNTDTNAYWQAEYEKLQAEKDAMYTDYESKLATWEKSGRGSNVIYTNPVTGETSTEDKTWKGPREIAMEEKMEKMQSKMDAIVAKSRSGGVEQQEKQTLINRLKNDLKWERAAHLAIQEAKTLVDLQWTAEVDRLETVVVQMNEKAETFKMAYQEEETRRIGAIQAANARIKRVEIESNEAIKEHKRQIKYAEVRQKALERELRRQVQARNSAGLAQAELEMKLFLFDEVKQKEFDVLRTKLRKARETHQDDLESLSALWPPATDGYLLPTILKPYTDVVRIEKDRLAQIAKAKALAKQRGVAYVKPEGEESDTDSDDEEAYQARRDILKELEMYKKEALMPSLRNLSPGEKARFKVTSMTPRRRRYVLWDTPRLYHAGDSEEEKGEKNDSPLSDRSLESRKDDPLYKAFGYSARSDKGKESARSESSSQALAAAVRMKLKLPPGLAQHRPATALAAIARRDYGAEPWDSDDEMGSFTHSARILEDGKLEVKEYHADADRRSEKEDEDGRANLSSLQYKPEESTNDNLKKWPVVDSEVTVCLEDMLTYVETRMGSMNVKNEVQGVMSGVLDTLEFEFKVREDIVGQTIENACELAPSTIKFREEQRKARELKLDKLRNPWKSENSRVMAHVPKVFSRALRSMLRNGTITKPRARQLALLYSKAPTLAEEDEAALSADHISARSVHSLVGETIKLAEEDEPEEDFVGEETPEGQADTRGRNESIRLLRREAELTEAIDMMHEQERHILIRRRNGLAAQLKRQDEHLATAKEDINSRTLVLAEKTQVAKLFEDEMLDLQSKSESRKEELDPESKRKRMAWLPSCTSVVPLPLDYEPDLVEHKVRILTRKVKVMEMQSKVDAAGNTTQVEVEVERDEEYEEEYTETLTIPAAMKREEERLIARIASFTETKKKSVSYEEVNEDGESVTKTRVEEYEEPLFPAPVNIKIKPWQRHEWDPPANVDPVQAIYIEMPDQENLERLMELLVPKIEKSLRISNRDALGSMFAIKTLEEQFANQQLQRRVKLMSLRRLARYEQKKVSVLGTVYKNAVEAKESSLHKLCLCGDEIQALNRRIEQSNRLHQVAENMKSWIIKAVGRSKQTKEELVLLARNAEGRVIRAQAKLAAAGNPLEEAALESDLDRILRESDRILRYVRRRFNTEMDTRRRLAEERRDVIRQQCSRYEVALGMGDERMSELRKLIRDQKLETKMLDKWHAKLVNVADIEGTQAVETHSEPTDGFKPFQNVCGDLPDGVNVAMAILDSVLVSAVGISLIITTVPKLISKITDGMGTTKVEEFRAALHTSEAVRKGRRKQELGKIQEAVDTLDGYAGQWLADNEVQQIEGQLNLTRTTLDEVQKESTKVKKEADEKIKDLDSRLQFLKTQHAAAKDMFEHELSSLRTSSSLSINYLKEAVKTTKDAMETLRKEKDAEIMRMAEAHAKKISEMIAKMEELEKVADRRKKWVESLQVQIGRMRKEAKRIELLRIAEHQAWEKERDGLTQQLEFHISQSDRRLQWVNSLKKEILVKEKEKEKVLLDMQKAARQHADMERELRWNIWQRDETARQIMMNVDSTFMFFVETISQLAGTSKAHNDRIAKNGGVGVLAALINRDNGREELKTHASRAIAAISWNGHVDHRVISRRVRDIWARWTAKIADEERWRFDLGESERKAIIEAEKQAEVAWKKNKNTAFALANRTVRLLKAAFVASLSAKSRAARDAEVLRGGQTVVGGPTTDYRHEAPESNGIRVESSEIVLAATGPNTDNQSAVGATHGALASLVLLCQEDDKLLQRYATDAIAVLALDENNRERLEQIQQCAPTLIELLDDRHGAEVQRNAAAAIGNMAFENPSNQNQLGDCGAVESLVNLCVEKETDIDVLENAAAALGNLARRNEANSLRIGICGGIEALVRLISSAKAADEHCGERVQANAAEALVNATRNDSHENAERIRACGIKPLVLLCTSKNLSVQRSAALVLGNIAQNDQNRIEVGSKGGIDALFILAATEDHVIQANAAWALGNLAWSASNQERIGFHMPRLLQLLTSRHDDIRANAMVCVANALFYNESNRRRVAFDNLDGLDLLIELLMDKSSTVQQHAARALGSAAHNDNIAKVGAEKGAIGNLVKLCYSPDPQCQRYSAFAMGNFALYDPNKKLILEQGGVEALTALMGSESHQARDLASDCLETLADLADEADMAMAKDKFGIGGTVDLLRGDNPLVTGMAADSLAEKVWTGGEKERTDIVTAGAIEALHALASDTNPHATRMKALWALRTIIQGSEEAKVRASANGLVETLIKILQSKPGSTEQWQQSNELSEVSLGVLAVLIVDNEETCRRVLRSGLDTLISIAEAGLPQPPKLAGRLMSKGSSGLENLIEKAKPWQVASKSNSEMSLELLQMIGPHNWILCAHCGTRNEGGTRCFQCARSIAFVL